MQTTVFLLLVNMLYCRTGCIEDASIKTHHALHITRTHIHIYHNNAIIKYVIHLQNPEMVLLRN
jgi:hypothetical protein